MAPDAKGGVSGEHPPSPTLPVLVAPTGGSLFNTLGPPGVPLACWRLEDLRFEFDSSIIKPDAKAEMADLARLWKKTGRPPLSLFGHADPVGDDEYNKTLSGRRATAVYGLLSRDVELWEKLYSQSFSSDNWQNGTLPMMRTTTGQAASTPRKEVFRAYMDAICQDENGQPFIVEKTGFLAQGKDPDGKGDYQGCSEFNPILLFSKSENQQLQSNKAERNRENQPNRRVMVFLFPPGLSVEPAAWPCPRAKEGSSGCRPHFWPDGDHRRDFQEKRREYEKDRDTFACRFYDSMANRSPCEIVRRTFTRRLLDPKKNAIPRARYTLRVGADERTGQADERGWLIEEDVVAPSKIHIEWDYPDSEEPYPFACDFLLDATLDDSEESMTKRLHNLGYVIAELSDNVRSFQRHYELPTTGQLDGPTREALTTVHDRELSRDEYLAR